MTLKQEAADALTKHRYSKELLANLFFLDSVCKETQRLHTDQCTFLLSWERTQIAKHKGKLLILIMETVTMKRFSLRSIVLEVGTRIPRGVSLTPI